jgi:hypothetical protein
LCDENAVAAARASFDAAIFNEVDDWVYDWCTHEENRKRLAQWDRQSDILDVLSQADLDNVGTCGPEAVCILRGALRHWYQEYRPPFQEQEAQAATRAVKLGYEDMAPGVSLPARAQDGKSCL